MLRTGKDYIESLRNGREVWIDGEQVQDVPAHPAFAPVVNVRARIYDLAREAGTKDLLTYVDDQSAERCATTSRRRAPARLAGQAGVGRRHPRQRRRGGHPRGR